MIRTATVNDKAALRDIWCAAFGDDVSYAGFAVDNCLALGTVLYHPEGMSCLTLFPLTLHRKGKSPLQGAYVYGVATHPDRQKRGYSSLLLYHASKLAKFLVLYPATEPLKTFYEKRGFTTPLLIPAPATVSAKNAPITDVDRHTALGAEHLFAAYREDGLKQPGVFLWSAPLFDYAYRECLFRGGFAGKEAFYYPGADGLLQCKPYLSGYTGNGFLEGLARFHTRVPGLHLIPPLFYLPLD
ncbi:MAG: GNAT family N-acetyltransferase [Bacteroidales bacterium]